MSDLHLRMLQNAPFRHGKVTGELRTYEERGENDDDVYVRRRFCPGCGSPIVSELAKSAGVVAVKAGAFDDNPDVDPTVQVWCTDKQPWVDLPGKAVSLDREQRLAHGKSMGRVLCLP